MWCLFVMKTYKNLCQNWNHCSQNMGYRILNVNRNLLAKLFVSNTSNNKQLQLQYNLHTWCAYCKHLKKVIVKCRTPDIWYIFLCVLDRASSWYLNKGWPTTLHLLYYILLNMFQTLIHPSSGASKYLFCCVGWFEACWCYVAGLAVGDVVSECRLNHYSAYTRIPHHQQTIPLHNTSMPQVSWHNTTCTR